MIKNLLTIQKKLKETIEFTEDGYLDLLAVEKKGSNLELKYKIVTGLENEPEQLWQITCYKVREHKIVLGEQYCDREYTEFKLFDDHVLLWSYNQPVSSLTFNNVNSNLEPHHIIGKLYHKHQELVGSWIPFNSCFNRYSDLTLNKLISLGHGKLAEGAEKLIIGYQEVMNECGFQSSYLSRPPKQSDEEKGWIDEKSNLQVFITGQSYVIAADLIAKRIID